MLWAEKDGLDVFNAFSNVSAAALLSYLVVYWLPRFVKAYQESNKTIAESHQNVVREVSNFWRDRGDKMTEMWDRQHKENITVQARLAKSISVLIHARHRAAGGDDQRPREG
jgi:hypothetical protein